jgi:uncharacterized protein (TIGR02147 family)
MLNWKGMSQTSIFDFSEYKSYLKQQAAIRDRSARGFRSQWAAAIRVQSAFISQVLRGTAHLSLEQAEATSIFLDHDVAESEYFLWMVQANRAGTASLSKFFEKKMKEMLRARRQIQERIQIQEGLSLEQQARYYSSWVYAAAHVLATIPKFQAPSAMQVRLGVSRSHLLKVTRDLVSWGILKNMGDRLVPGKKQIHLGADSPLLSKHQQNWRLRAVNQIDAKTEEEAVCFSGIVSVSLKDAERIRERLRREIEELMKIVAPSPEEELFAINIDFFRP